MTCYFRHLKEVFLKADIEVTSDNKREIDRVVHGLIGEEYKHCPDVWREIKTRLAQDEAGFVLALQQTWKSR
jgi:ATP-dependent Zn protease